MTFPQAHQSELTELAEIAGISTASGVFRIVLELLALQVSPEDIYILLKQISTKSLSSLSQQISEQDAYASTSSAKK